MKNLLPLFASALLLAGCADDTTNPWSTEQERADAKVIEAEKTAPTTTGTNDTAPTAKYSWQKKVAEEAEKPAELAADKAVITALRGDAGLIQIKRAEASAPGDKLTLTHGGKSLLIVVHTVDGDAVIANIAPLQVNKPALKVGDTVTCTPFQGDAK